MPEVDDELLQIAREAVAARYGLSADQARRLRGATAKALDADARLMCKELGRPVPDERQRDEQGRYVGSEAGDMNRIIREAAGR